MSLIFKCSNGITQLKWQNEIRQIKRWNTIHIHYPFHSFSFHSMTHNIILRITEYRIKLIVQKLLRLINLLFICVNIYHTSNVLWSTGKFYEYLISFNHHKTIPIIFQYSKRFVDSTLFIAPLLTLSWNTTSQKRNKKWNGERNEKSKTKTFVINVLHNEAHSMRSALLFEFTRIFFFISPILSTSLNFK